MFEDFNFSILADREFKEDAVREELVVPILTRLGYSATGEHRIVRSKPLVHPFVYIGTKQYKVNIIPDYVVSVAGSIKWVLDAKAPVENILTGKNVEQAYSYAIHKDVRVSHFGLCNGHALAVFHISHVEPLLHVPLTEIDNRWSEVSNILCPMAFIDPERLEFFPDYGLAMLRLGAGTSTNVFFPWVPVHFIAKASDNLVAVSSTFDLGGDFCATFDLDMPMYKTLLETLPKSDRENTRLALSHQPYHIDFRHNPPSLSIKARIKNEIIDNGREKFVPFKVIKLEASEFAGEDMLKAMSDEE